MTTIEAADTTSASPVAVWALLADAPAWARWGSWSKVEVESGDAQGPGQIRVLVRRPFRLRERITEWVPGERLSYEMLEGMRVRGYRSTVTLEEEAGAAPLSAGARPTTRLGPSPLPPPRMAVRDACKRLAKAASA